MMREATRNPCPRSEAPSRPRKSVELVSRPSAPWARVDPGQARLPRGPELHDRPHVRRGWGFRGRIAASLVLAVLAQHWCACSTFRPGESWTFAITRNMFDGEVPDDSGTVKEALNKEAWSKTQPYRGGVEELWVAAVLLLPTSIGMGLDIVCLPVELVHDGYVALAD